MRQAPLFSSGVDSSSTDSSSRNGCRHCRSCTTKTATAATQRGCPVPTKELSTSTVQARFSGYTLQTWVPAEGLEASQTALS